jgi:polysaccharide pyruvyl transferase CsaB
LGRKKTVVLSGYFGFGNFGDEVILSVLKDFFSSINLNVISLLKNPEHKNEVGRYNIFEIIKTIKHADIVVNGGGGLLQDKTSIRSLIYYLGILFISEKLRKCTACFAQGIGPIKRRIGSLILRLILNKVNLITVRDEYSYHVLEESGVNNKNIHVTADVAFLFSREKKISLPFEKFILYAPGKALHMPEMETLVNIGKFIKEETGLPLLIVPFYPARDGIITTTLSYTLNATLVIPEQIEQYAYIVNKSSFVVGMRYHAILFSILKKKAFVGLSYDPKVNALMNEIGVKGIDDYSKFTLDDFKTVFRNNFSKREEIEKLLENKLGDFKVRAEENFALFTKTFLST